MSERPQVSIELNGGRLAPAVAAAAQEIAEEAEADLAQALALAGVDGRLVRLAHRRDRWHAGMQLVQASGQLRDLRAQFGQFQLLALQGLLVLGDGEPGLPLHRVGRPHRRPHRRHAGGCVRPRRPCP